MLAGGGLLSACDALSERAERAAVPSALVLAPRAASTLVTPEGVRVSEIAPDQILDPRLEPEDTHRLFDVASQTTTVAETGGTLFDPVTQTTPQEMRFEAPVETHHVEVGYTGSGDLVVGRYALDAPGDPYEAPVDEGRTVRAVGHVLEAFDAAGQPIPLEPGETFTPQRVLEEVGESVGDLLVLDEPPPGEGGAADGTGQAAGMRGASVTVRHDAEGMTVREEHAAAPGLASPGDVQRTTRRYRRVDGRYWLDEATVEQEMELGEGRRLRTTTRTRFRILKVKDNKARNEARRARRGRAGTSALPPAATTLGDDPCRYARECTGDPDEPTPGTPEPDPCPATGTGPGFVFVHGFWSDGAAWGPRAERGYVRADVRCSFQNAGDIAVSMDNKGLGSHTSQEAELRQDVVATGRPDNVFIAHSQGGIISRRLAQTWGAAPSGAYQARAVITIDSPHQGAQLARVVSASPDPGSLFGALLERIATASIFSLLGSKTAGVLGATSDVLLGTVLSLKFARSDAAHDLSPGSAQMAYVNTRYEPFRRFGLQNTPKQSWMLFRLVCDTSGGNGETCAKVINGLFMGAGLAGIVATITGNVPLLKAAVWVGAILWTLDQTLHRMVGRTSDGVVTYASQVYPNTRGTFPPENVRIRDRGAVSHTAVQRSGRVSERVRIFLRKPELGLIERQQ